MAALIYDEVELFVVCLALGMVLAFVYDCVRIFRLFFNHKDWLVDVEDLHSGFLRHGWFFVRYSFITVELFAVMRF